METEIERVLALARQGDDGDALAALHAAGLTDGLPAVLPTPARVEQMLGGRDPGAALGPLPPLRRDADLRSIATCAVMAGCLPQELDVLVAATTALLAPELNLIGVATTTGNAAVGAILHGPLVGRLGANAGAGALGPGNRVNASIGRALSLVVRLVGGAEPGIVDMATLGQPAKLGCCLAEGPPPEPWTPLSRRRGVEGSAVTVFACSGLVEVVDTLSRDARGLLETLASAIPLPATMASSGQHLGGGQVVVVLPPEWAQRLVAAGWSERDVATFLHEHSACPLERLSPALRERAASAAPSGALPSAHSPEDVLLVVAGGVGIKAAFLPTWSGGTSAVTVALPDAAAAHPAPEGT